MLAYCRKSAEKQQCADDAKLTRQIAVISHLTDLNRSRPGNPHCSAKRYKFDDRRKSPFPGAASTSFCAMDRYFGNRPV
jgi:hypothetical protein